MTMRSLPTNIYSVAAVRETDRTTIEDHGVPGYTLMSRAGEAAVREARAITAATVTSSRASRRRKVPLFQF
jgi:NAD(P)H-hydrate repair Nnr-like enzyme with NAD(P)H-hydrate epimerase domain